MVSLKLLAFIISVPLVSIYIGYTIGNYLVGPPRRFPDDNVVVDSYMLNYTWQNSHRLSIDFAGGLGNMMFQYASLYGIAKGNTLIPVVTGNHPFTTVFQHLTIRMTHGTNDWQQWAKFREMRTMGYDRRAFSLNFMRNIHLEGFYQSWKYFEHVKRDIRKQFQFSTRAEETVHQFLQDARIAAKWPFREKLNAPPKDITFIGIHVRRGDFVLQKSMEQGYIAADFDYIERAMDYFHQKFENVIFVVCSDDKQWSQNNVKSASNPIVFSPFDTASFDLCVLSKCNHTIMTSGTFSWWAGFLAGGEAVYYKGYPRPGSPLYYSSFIHDDYYYPHWIGMS